MLKIHGAFINCLNLYPGVSAIAPGLRARPTNTSVALIAFSVLGICRRRPTVAIQQLGLDLVVADPTRRNHRAARSCALHNGPARALALV